MRNARHETASGGRGGGGGGLRLSLAVCFAWSHGLSLLSGDLPEQEREQQKQEQQKQQQEQEQEQKPIKVGSADSHIIRTRVWRGRRAEQTRAGRGGKRSGQRGQSRSHIPYPNATRRRRRRLFARRHCHSSEERSLWTAASGSRCLGYPCHAMPSHGGRCGGRLRDWHAGPGRQSWTDKDNDDGQDSFLLQHAPAR